MIDHQPVPIVRIGNGVLTRKAQPVSDVLRRSEAFEELIAVMRATLKDTGVGLAAPQVGVSLRVFAMEDPKDWVENDKLRDDKERVPFPFTVVINPDWVKANDEQKSFPEGCLSIPGLQASVPRYRTIHARWTGPSGESVERELVGWPARIFQHEHDHLEGTLYLDYIKEKPAVSYPDPERPEGVEIALLRALGLT
jgi:peptide deformylase